MDIPSNIFMQALISASASIGRKESIFISQPLNKQKRELSQLQKWTRPWAFSALGIHTGPFVVLQHNFVFTIFQLFHFHTGEPILNTPESQ